MTVAPDAVGVTVVLLVWLAMFAVGLVVTYWIIRLAVRDGILAAQRQGVALSSSEHVDRTRVQV